jgi:predicted AAA+ superfamily ATPase
MKEVSESLAGRIGFVDPGGVQLWEVGLQHRDRLWIRGGLPRAFLADSESDSMQWRENFIRTWMSYDVQFTETFQKWIKVLKKRCPHAKD